MTEQKKPWVWLLGGSRMSEPMCHEIKNRGYELLLTDRNPSCHCRQFADRFYPKLPKGNTSHYSVYDPFNNLAIARLEGGSGSKYGPASAVLTIGTDAGPMVSQLSFFFDLPRIHTSTALSVKDKIRMRSLIDSDYPNWMLIDKCFSDAPLSLPFVAKLPNLSGSRGFQLIKSTNDWQVYQYANKDEDAILVEEYMEGVDLRPEWREYGFDTSEVALDFFVQDGQVIYANGALRLFWADMAGIEAGHINPFEADEEIMALAQGAAAKLGVNWGPFKMDLKYTRQGWAILECATRLSGGFDHGFTAPLATGRNITSAMLDVALGGHVDSEKLLNRKGKFAACYAPRFEQGKIGGFNYPEDGLDLIFENHNGQINKLTCNQDRPLFLIKQGDTEDEALKNVIQYAKKVKPGWC